MNDAPLTPSQSVSQTEDCIAVLRVDGHYRIVATRAIPRGSPLLEIDGEFTDRPSRFSVQIGDGLHVDVPGDVTAADVEDRYRWRFLNHSCDPNARFEGLRLVAARDIEPWEQVYFDYNSTELELAEPFQCTCGSSRCVGTVAGYRHLDAAQRDARTSTAARHLIDAAG